MLVFGGRNNQVSEFDSTEKVRQSSDSLFLDSFDILNISLPYLLFLSLLHNWHYVFFIRHFGIWGSIFSAFLKIYFYAGLIGSLGQLCFENKTHVSLKSIFDFANRYWWKLGALTFVQIFIDDKMAMIFSSGITSFGIPLLECGLYLISALYVIHSEYLKPIRFTSIHLTLPEGLCFISIFIIQICLVNFEVLTGISVDSLMNVLLFTSIYFYFGGIILFYLILKRTCNNVSQKTPKELILVSPMNSGILMSMDSFILPPPAVFSVIRAFTPGEYHIEEISNIFWSKRYLKSNCLVAITCFTSNCADAYAIAKQYRKKGSTVIIGGPHVTFLPDEALRFCDAVLIGDAEGIWSDIVKDYENGTLKRIYEHTATIEEKELVLTKAVDFPVDKLRAFVMTTMGCKFHCDFCTVPRLYDDKCYSLSIPLIVKLIEIMKRKGSGFFLFLDNNIYSNPSYAKQLFKALIPLKIQWTSCASLDIAADEDALLSAKQSGCTELLFGYEIFDSADEANKGGKLALAKKYQEYSRLLKKSNIKIKAHFIYGFEDDTVFSISNLWNFCWKIKPNITALSFLTPFPGSELFYKFFEQDRIINYNWRYYHGSFFVFKHEKIHALWAKFIAPIIKTVFILTSSYVGVLILLASMFCYFWFFVK